MIIKAKKKKKTCGIEGFLQLGLIVIFVGNATDIKMFTTYLYN